MYVYINGAKCRHKDTIQDSWTDIYRQFVRHDEKRQFVKLLMTIQSLPFVKLLSNRLKTKTTETNQKKKKKKKKNENFKMTPRQRLLYETGS